jgi:Ca-activated chloride channel homolog
VTPEPSAARLLAALLMPLLLLALRAFVRRRRQVARSIGDRELVRRMVGVDLGRLPLTRLVPVALAGACIALALAVPLRGAEEPAATEATRAAGIVLALDASVSMLATDAEPDRLEVMRLAARGIAERAEGTPVGIVAFAGRAYVLSPPTTDRAAIDLYLAALEPGMVVQSGSSVAGGLRQGVALLSGGEARGGEIVLITDGDASDEVAEIRAAAALARNAGITVHVGGAGRPGGAPVPAVDLATGARDGVMRDPAGEVIVSRLGEELLREVASATGGRYLRLESSADAQRLAGLVDGTGRAGGEGGLPIYLWLGVAAVLLLLAEGAAQRREREP